VHRLLADPAVDRLDERFSPATEHLAIAARSLAAADELAERVVQLLRWSERPLSMTVHHLPDLISAAVTRSHTTFGGEAAQMRVVGDLPDVVADDEQIEWALAELVTNARKFHHQPGQLGGAPVPMEIGLATADERRAAAYPDDPRFAVVALRDRGIGVAPTLADDAFAPARKLQPRGDYPGVGMGLALCALVFERHAGWCRILTARPGATAVWRVPLAPAASPGGGDRPL
jgi:light-regulated signal transduction histidine kinase (bacteriophytochrome)